MDNTSYEMDGNVYANCQTPDVIIGQPITAQPSNKPLSEEPITLKVENDDSDEEKKKARRGRGRVDTTDKIYSVDGEQTNRDWATRLFFSITGSPHKRQVKENFKQTCRDCGCVPCMMCSIAKRLGDPGYLPFVPCTGPAVRFKVRILGGISGTIGNDCLVTSCCWPCAVCQMHREMDDIGI
ncbi:uncharacterized protein [Littorina saxatilis]|uniref:Uncharacterized protein n=1 Tax=Littorina saxatilis TaxID=31220 RepID=A0AAN9GHW1_9CAEN